MKERRRNADSETKGVEKGKEDGQKNWGNPLSDFVPPHKKLHNSNLIQMLHFAK